MTRLRRSVSIAGSMFIIAGLVAAVAVRTAAIAPAAVQAPALGADVSPFTTVSSWTQVQQAGNSFVGVEAAFAATAEKTYASDVTAAANVGLYVMPYAFAFPYNPTANGSVAKQAETAVSTVESVSSPADASSDLMLPLAVDMEYDPYYRSEGTTQCYGLTPSAMVTWIKTFIADVKALKRTPVIYTTTSFWTDCTASSTDFSAYPLWLASFGPARPALPSGWSSATFWQYSDTGTVTGIAGNTTDLDYLGPVVQVGQVSKAIAPVLVRTLNSLNGQSVSYTPATLLPGVSVNAAGRITGTPTRVGQYAVTVTPSTAGSVPAAMSFTWDVHGTIALSATNRSSTAGAPVSLKLAASGPDQNAGFAPALKATGLPTGLSMTSAGVITGWLARQGTFTVRVTASDGLGGSGSASFTWTVKAAADSGTAGQVRQVGGSGKCLNDPAGNTANGTLVTLWTCTGKSNQRWTTVQDGTLRTGGKCLSRAGNSTASGAKLALATCNAANGAQHWLASTDGQLINPQSGKCLDVPPASAANGTHPVIEPCANSTSQPNEHWIRPAAPIASGQPGKCLAMVTNSSVALRSCANVAAQHWQPRADGTIRAGAGCLTDPEPVVGSPIAPTRCDSSKSIITWKLVSVGPIATELVSTASGLCASASSTGTKLVMAACSSTPAVTWRIG